MNNTLTIKQPFRFNTKHFVVLIAITVLLFVISNIVTVKQVAENTPDFSIEDISEIAEEIYSSGTIADAVENLPLDAALIEKMKAEIERILAKTTDYSGCEVYYLQVIYGDNFPILGYGNAISGFVYLEEGNVWKV